MQLQKIYYDRDSQLLDKTHSEVISLKLSSDLDFIYGS